MTNTNKPLTKMAISRIKTGMTLSDTAENAGLRITKGKTRTTFYYRYRDTSTKKLKRAHIGYFPSISLADARQILEQMKQTRLSGGNPQAISKTAVAKAKTKQLETATLASEHGKTTVSQMVDCYLRQNVYKDRKLKGAKECDRMMTAGIINIIGERLAEDITKQDVVDLINAEITKGNRVQAGNILRELVRAYGFLQLGFSGAKCEHLQLPPDFINPAMLAREIFKLQKVSFAVTAGKRWLTANELSLLLHWLHRPKMLTQQQRTAMLLTLRLGMRSGEVCALQWKNINLKLGTIDLIETKTGASRTIVLPHQVKDYLLTLDSYKNKDKYLCPSNASFKPKIGYIIQRVLTTRLGELRRKDKLPDIDHWSPHDLRRTARTQLAKLGCPFEIAEAILGHSRGGIEGVYNLHQYEKEAGEWLQKWNDELDSYTDTGVTIACTGYPDEEPV